MSRANSNREIDVKQGSQPAIPRTLPSSVMFTSRSGQSKGSKGNLTCSNLAIVPKFGLRELTG